MEQIILRSFDEMVATYAQILQIIYPARGNTGFTEVNQVHIYINSLINRIKSRNLSISYC